MIKCFHCKSYKVCLTIKEKQYKIINECFNCYNNTHLFIDDYINNYKEFYSSLNHEKEIISEIHNCSKHSKEYISFCYNCKEMLCEECFISHDSKNHCIQKIKEIISDKENKEIIGCKKELNSLKNVIEIKLEK